MSPSKRTNNDKGRKQASADPARLEFLADGVFAIALTLLALDLRLPVTAPEDLGTAIAALAPRLAVFVFAFLAIAQQWDVHRRTMLHVRRTDSALVWWQLLALMFVVLMPASADILGRFALEPLALVVFGCNIALLCLCSWAMWRHAAGRGGLLDTDASPDLIRMIGRLWLYPVVVIAATLPIAFVSVFPVYLVWFLMPIASYMFSARSLPRPHARGK